MFKEIGAKFSYKGYTNFGTPYVTEDVRKAAPNHTIEDMMATRIFTPTQEGQMVAGVFADVARKSFFNLAAGAYLEFQNLYDNQYMVHNGENVFAPCYKCWDGGRIQYYYFRKITGEKDSSIMIYNPCFRKCVVMYAVMQEGCETYVECIRTAAGIQTGFLSMKPGISPVRTRVWSVFVLDEKTVSGLEEAKYYYENVSQRPEVNMLDLAPFREGALKDICFWNE